MPLFFAHTKPVKWFSERSVTSETAECSSSGMTVACKLTSHFCFFGGFFVVFFVCVVGFCLVGLLLLFNYYYFYGSLVESERERISDFSELLM